MTPATAAALDDALDANVREKAEIVALLRRSLAKALEDHREAEIMLGRHRLLSLTTERQC